MKKIFFPKSSSSQGGGHHERSVGRSNKKQPAQTRQKAGDCHNGDQHMVQKSDDLFPVCERKVTERQTISKSFVMKRSRSLSMSSAAGKGNGGFSEEDLTELRKQQKFPSSRSVCGCPDCNFQSRDKKPERYDVATTRRPPAGVLCSRACSSPSDPSSPQSSFGSTSISGQMLDLHMDDGDQHQEKLRKSHNFSSIPTGLQDRFFAEKSNLFLPPHCASSDSLRSERQRESPRKLAKDVVERLLFLEQLRDSNPGEVCSSWPPVLQTVRDKHLDRQSHTAEDDISGKDTTLKDILDEKTIAIDNRGHILEREYGRTLPEPKRDATDSALRRKLEEVKHRAKQLSEELADRNSLQSYTGNISALCHMIRSLIEEERNTMVEFSDHLQYRIGERAAARKEASELKEEMNSSVVKLEREKDELQCRFHRELDRRSDESESKLREFQLEEHRLRDRVRELAEQNASLQGQQSAFYNKENEYKDRLSSMEAHLKDTIAKMDLARSENNNLQKKLSDVEDKLEIAEEVRCSIEKSFKEKEKENTELIKVVSRLRGTCSDQERTIDGLRQCLVSENEKPQNSGKLEKLTYKLKMEQSRLTEVEQVLRRQLEACTVEVESLRVENIHLLERLKDTGKVTSHSAIKLDQELLSCVQCLKNKGLTVATESIQTCEELLRIVGRRETPRSILEMHTLMQYDMKIQGFKQGLKQLTRSLVNTASVVQEKDELVNQESESSTLGNDNVKRINKTTLEEDLKSELNAEMLLTRILKEKLYSKEKEIERAQAELVRALRSNDVLKSEAQDAFDTVSCVNHKMKNLELQMIEKNGTINQLQGELNSLEEEIASTRSTVSKIRQERDLMWEEVKQYSEKNMLLNRELNSLKKKIDALEEDTLLKDGQISILKDSLNNVRPFDILFGSEQGESAFNL